MASRISNLRVPFILSNPQLIWEGQGVFRACSTPRRDKALGFYLSSEVGSATGLYGLWKSKPAEKSHSPTSWLRLWQ
ncbi:hypothetical protein GDO81_024102 [Engystomops pustulosus]|uniref:Uncharacterized protein n=1 Tax=Engystomops pustulosus TaxID=76066 RepID=A0AAV6YJI4_ENGPU|nr:hypothetical protein GDO81_024102 [Engystomops pustulosus]